MTPGERPAGALRAFGAVILTMGLFALFSVSFLAVPLLLLALFYAGVTVIDRNQARKRAVQIKQAPAQAADEPATRFAGARQRAGGRSRDATRLGAADADV